MTASFDSSHPDYDRWLDQRAEERACAEDAMPRKCANCGEWATRVAVDEERNGDNYACTPCGEAWLAETDWQSQPFDQSAEVEAYEAMVESAYDPVPYDDAPDSDPLPDHPCGHLGCTTVVDGDVDACGEHAFAVLYGDSLAADLDPEETPFLWPAPVPTSPR